MTRVDYKAIVKESIQKLLGLFDQRDALALEIEKQLQFVNATFNLLSDEDKWEVDRQFRPVLSRISAGTKSLADSVRNILQQAYPDRLTAAEVRDKLRANGFDFSSYTSNPLSSVSTTLRRLMQAREITMKRVESVATFQTKRLPNTPQADRLLNKLE